MTFITWKSTSSKLEVSLTNGSTSHPFLAQTGSAKHARPCSLDIISMPSVTQTKEEEFPPINLPNFILLPPLVGCVRDGELVGGPVAFIAGKSTETNLKSNYDGPCTTFLAQNGASADAKSQIERNNLYQGRTVNFATGIALNFWFKAILPFAAHTSSNSGRGISHRSCQVLLPPIVGFV